VANSPTILVVDDSATQLRTTVHLLRAAGYEVLEASTGDEGLRLARAERPDLILLDVALPGIDSLELCRRIRADEALADAAVVLCLSFDSDFGSQAEAMEAGADATIVRPIPDQELLAWVQAALRLKQTEVELKRRARQQAALAELGQRALAGEKLDVLMAASVELAARALDATHTAIAELQPDGETLLLRAGVGWAEGLVGQATARLTPDSPAGYVLRAGAPVVVEDVERGVPFSLPPWAREMGLASGLAAVIAGEDQPFGLLGVFSAERRTFTRDDLAFLQSLANVLASSVQREQTTRALQEHKNLLQRVIDAMPTYIMVKDRDGTFLLVNEATATYYGLTRQQMVGMKERELARMSLHTDEEVERFSEIDRQVIDRQQPITIVEVEHARSDRPRWFQTAKIPLRVGDNPDCVLVVATDITEQRRAREELQRRTAQLEAVHQVGLELAAQLELDELLRSIASRAVELVGGTEGGLYLYRPERDVLEWAVATGGLPVPLGTTLEKGEGLSGKVWQTGEPLAVDDYLAWEGSSPKWARTAASRRAVAGVPIRWGKEFLGVLNVAARPGQRFSQADVELLELLAGQAAIAVHNAQLYDEERRRARRLAIVNRVASAASATLDVDELLEKVYEEISDAFPYDAYCFALYDEAAQELDFRTLVDAGIREPPQRRPLDTGLTSRVVRERRPLLVRDLERELEQLLPLETWGTLQIPASVLGVPVQVRGRVIGAILLQSYRLHEYDDEDQRILTTVADQVAVALENARLYEEAQGRAAHLAALNAVIAAAASAPDLPHLLETALDSTLEALGLEAGAAWIEGHRVLRGLPQALGPAMARAVREVNLADMPAAVVVDDWEQVAAGAAAGASWSSLAPLMARFGIRASIVTPVFGQERRTGGMVVTSRTPLAWPAEEAALVEAIGHQLGAAAERLRLLEAEREQRELAEALAHAAAALSGTLDFDQVLDRILDQVKRVVASDAYGVMLVEEEGDTARIVRWRGRWEAGDEQGTDPLGFVLPVADYANLKAMAETGEPYIIPDTSAAPEWARFEGGAWQRSYVGAPIRVGGRTVGFLNVTSAQPHRFGPADARRLAAFADHAAVAIETARLHRELREHAHLLEERVRQRTADLQAQVARLEAVLRSVAEGIAITDAQGQILQANLVVENWLTRALSPEDAGRLREAMRGVAARAAEHPTELLELKGLDLELRSAPIVEPGAGGALHRPPGRPAAVVAIHDVSGMRALDRMKTRFITNISHELRTPITTIKLYAYLLRQGRPEKQRQYLDALAEEADLQAQIIEDILRVSEIDAGRLEMRPLPAELNNFVEAVAASYRALAQERGVALEVRLAEPSPVVSVDPEWMGQVLDKLVDNAVHYTPEGGSIVVSTGTAEADGRVWATVTVADTGIGIPADELPHIFDRFYRGEEPRAMQMTGTGLGLAIVREIVELHGGRVTVESEKGVGSTFTVWLPVGPSK